MKKTLLPLALGLAIMLMAFATTDLAYSGLLRVGGIFARSGSFTVAHRIENVTTGASAIVATMPTSPTVGDTYTVLKIDAGAGTVVVTRAGSQTLNGATTKTLSTQYTGEHCIYVSSNLWYCEGAGS